MDKVIAKCLADSKVKEILSDGKERVQSLLSESKHEFEFHKGVEYQIRANAFYEDKEKKIIRVSVTVDDQGFWSTLLPVSGSDFFEER
uniref:Uncharacterized protein n=1 Tax=Candidatus Kentrum sp. LFY TaxID=2126342 RepID=A0A450ULX7_9GAMM|nr:MAG: hypothetical protein BECKLFY1418B_GA0070995_104716 [Candidatus Kentron sp. LFY]